MHIRRFLTSARQAPKIARLVFLILTMLAIAFTGGCSFSVSGSSKTAASTSGKSKKERSTSGNAKASAGGKASAKSEGKSSAEGSGKKSASVTAKGSTSGSASGKSSSKSSVKVSGSKTYEGNARLVFSSKARAKGVSRSHKTSDDFRATFLVGGVTGKSYAFGSHASGKAGGSLSLSGKLSGGGAVKGGGSTKEKPSDEKSAKKDPTEKTPPKKDPPKKQPPEKAPPQETAKNDPPQKKPEPEPEPAPAPEEQEVVEVIEPPEDPPENVFGYDKPVRGCFEGIVYPLESDTQKLPTNWESMGAVSVVYACEWDIPTRDWETGFPGVDELFEWFAIRYTGSFWVDTPGTWKFRVSSDDGMKLFIDDKLVLDNDGQHPPQVKEVTIDLSKGEHDMVIEYFQGPRYHINLQLYATPPGGEEGIFSVR